MTKGGNVITLTLSYKVREALTYALTFYEAHAEDSAQESFDVRSIAKQLSHTKCGDSGCQFCGDDPYYGED